MSWTIRRKANKFVLDLLDEQPKEATDENMVLKKAKTEEEIEPIAFDASVTRKACFDELRSPPESESEEEDADDEDKRSFEEKLEALLILFFILYKVPRDGVKLLLGGLRKLGVQAPRSKYMIDKILKGEKTDTSLEPMGEGQFRYFGIGENLQMLLKKGLLNLTRPDDLHSTNESRVYSFCALFNSDGLPLFKSSQFGLWPILMMIPDAFPRPFPVGIYAGKGKPPLQAYLREFCNEAKKFLSAPVRISESVQITISAIRFVCDAPARAYICGILGHTAYAGCGYCRAVGIHFKKRMTFSTVVGESRCGEMYRAGQESNQQRKTGNIIMSPLLQLPNVDFVNSFPVEFQHAVCLGAVRKFFYFYFDPEGGRKVKKDQISHLSDRIAALTKYTPSNFQRRPRRLSDLKFFKASEYRQFLLYLGPVLFKGFLPELLYNHFLLLHFAMYVYSSDRHTKYWDQAKSSVEVFVEQTAIYFGQEAISYNIHALLHFDQFVRLYGNINSFTTFPFENYLGAIKRRIKVTRHLAAHSVNEIVCVRNLMHDDPVKPLKYSSKMGDNACFIRNICVLIEHITEERVATGRVLKPEGEIYSQPYSSMRLGIGIYRLTEEVLIGKPEWKCWLLPKSVADSTSSASRPEADETGLFYVVPLAGGDCN